MHYKKRTSKVKPHLTKKCNKLKTDCKLFKKKYCAGGPCHLIMVPH